MIGTQVLILTVNTEDRIASYRGLTSSVVGLESIGSLWYEGVEVRCEGVEVRGGGGGGRGLGVRGGGKGVRISTVHEKTLKRA